jgi:hypothetical protein
MIVIFIKIISSVVFFFVKIFLCMICRFKRCFIIMIFKLIKLFSTKYKIKKIRNENMTLWSIINELMTENKELIDKLNKMYRLQTISSDRAIEINVNVEFDLSEYDGHL